MVRAYDFSGYFSGYTALGSATAYAVATGYIDDDAITTAKRQNLNTYSAVYAIGGQIATVYNIPHNLGKIMLGEIVSGHNEVAMWMISQNSNSISIGAYKFTTGSIFDPVFTLYYMCP